MKSFLVVLSAFMLINVSQAQMSDSALVQSLIKRHHLDIRRSFIKLGLTYTQKKQVEVGKGKMKYIFFIKGTEGNTKTWEVYTEKFNRDSVLVTRILIKYYYKNPGDIIELYNFDVSGQFQFADDYLYTFIKSEGKKQADIEIKTVKLFEYDGSKTKTFSMIFPSRFSTPDSESNDLYLQLIKDTKGANTKYHIKAYIDGVYTCVGLPNNFLGLSFENNKSIVLKENNPSAYCDNSANSYFNLKDEDIELLKKDMLSYFRIKQGGDYKEFKVLRPNLFSHIIVLLSQTQ